MASLEIQPPHELPPCKWSELENCADVRDIACAAAGAAAFGACKDRHA